MKRKVSKFIVQVVLVTIIILVSKYLFKQDISFINVLFLFAILSFLELAYNIIEGIENLKRFNKTFYDEICEVEEAKYSRYFQMHQMLSSIQSILVNDKTPKENDAEAIKQKANDLRAQASKEDSDSKAYGLEVKAKRENNLAQVISSGLLANLGIFYEVLWDEKQNCLRIVNFQQSGKVAVFYPKANKLNFRGSWTTSATDYLTKHLKDLEDVKGDD